MASSTRDGNDRDAREIRLVEDGEWWVATDETTGVTTQGKTRRVALENLDEAVALYHGDVGRAPTDEELREVGIDPPDNHTGDTESPDVLD